MKRTFFTATLLASLFAAPVAFAETVNINKADAAKLDTLDGIGEKKAEAIVAYRTEHGEFKTLEDLKEVSGIGDKLFEKIKADVSLTDDATVVAEKPAKEGAEEKTVKADADAEKMETKTDSKEQKAEPADKADKVSDKAPTKADKS